ncbi:MAG: MBL fold metallo-hydrolase [Glaciimonas sp.]|nr:MBL fold metallo-hydrolase [Glaciimonas sp.]
MPKAAGSFHDVVYIVNQRGSSMKALQGFLFSTIAALSLVAGPASAESFTQAPGYYRMPLGDFKITVLSDGTAPRDLASIMSKPDVVRAEYASAHETLPVELSINCFLIDTGKQRILVDTGAGELFGATSGKLVANLNAAGYSPQDVDTVLLTHIHADHSGGLTVAGTRYRGLAKAHLQHMTTAAAMNVEPITAWLMGQPQAKTRTSRCAQLAA